MKPFNTNAKKINANRLEKFLTKKNQTYILTLKDRAIIDRDIKFFSGGSCAFLEKITFSSHSGQTAPLPLNIKTVVERPIFNLGLPNFECSFYFL